VMSLIKFRGLLKATEGRNYFIQRLVAKQEAKLKKASNEREQNQILEFTTNSIQLAVYTKHYVDLRDQYGPLQISRREYLEREAATVGLQLPPKPDDLQNLPDDKDTTKWR